MIRMITAPLTTAVVLLAAACGADPPADPPRYCGDAIPQQTVLVGESKSVAVCFEDPGGGDLTMSAVSSDESVAQASARGDSIALRGVSPGDATITVTVKNADDLSADTSFSVLVSSNPAPNSEREALVALYEATGGPGWARNRNWLSDEPLGEWEGVGTGQDGAVFWIDLNDNRLEGRLPAQIGYLRSLENLRLYNNRLVGPLPAELANASDMRDLDLRQNGLTGSIPTEFTRMTAMYRFYWEDNDGLCAPTDEEFQSWLAGVGYAEGPTCQGG